jgi:eukaryotic-like serine/threonine-protein kinase
VNTALERLSAALADRYRIERELGAGGMATVYLAQDLKHDRNVAIKVLKPELAAVLGAERFVQEIKTTAALSHPHILPLFDSGEAGGFLYYVMPYIQGETIRERLNRETQLSVDEAVRITREIADALDYAHRNGVIHRDIKPENLLLHDGRPMVMDFGIALAVSAAAGGRMTETGLSLGTPHYMSPEQATADKSITARSDVYSLASVCYEMLAGEPPHTGGSAQQIIMKIIAERAQPVTELRNAVPMNVAAALGKALEKLPADRFDTAKAFADALVNPTFATAAMTGARATDAGTSKWHRDPRTAVLGAVATVALGAALWMTARPSAVAGPTEYDVALPDSARFTADTLAVGFSIAPQGDFVIYESSSRGRTELWYRSLLDGTARPIPGAEGGSNPVIAPDGRRVAFIRRAAGGATISVIPVDGGAPVSLTPSDETDHLLWRADGRLVVIGGDGTLRRVIDPTGGSQVQDTIAYCILPTMIPGDEAMVCGGGGAKYMYRGGTAISSDELQRQVKDPSANRLLGSTFHVVDGRYVVYLSNTGDLMAASFDSKSWTVGRSVRMRSGLGRRSYTGAGTFALSESGTLVYADGENRSLGHLVVGRPGRLDTLPAGREAFLRFAMTPDRKRLAAVVETLEGEQLRIYDLQTGRFAPWFTAFEVRQPTWNPQADSIAFAVADSLFIGSPNDARAPRGVQLAGLDFEPFAWRTGGRLFGTSWERNEAVVVGIEQRPYSVDTLARDVAFPLLSPDERWLAYSDRAFTTAWLEPYPADGRRYQLKSGGVGEAHWLSSKELLVTYWDSTGWRADRVQIGASPAAGTTRSPWIRMARFLDPPGLSVSVTPDGGLMYVQGSPATPVSHFRVVPNWVAEMKRAVDAASP